MSEFRRHIPPDASLASLHLAFSRVWDALEAQVTTTGSAAAPRLLLASPAITSQGSSPTTTVRHNDTSGIQGGSIDNYYHLTNLEYTGTGTGVFARADSPVLTGIPQSTTAAIGTSTAQIATTKFVADHPITHDYTLSGDGTVASPLIIPPYLTFGVLNMPSYTNNGNGTITLGAGDYCLATLVSGECIPKQYALAGGVFTPTNNATSYLVADYNSGSPILHVITDVTLINETTVIPVHTFYREGLEVHQIDWDTLGVALANKIHQSLVKTQRFRRQDGMIIGEAPTRLVTVTAGTTWVGAVPITSSAFTSATDTLRLYSHVAGVWTESAITQYNNSQYDDGTTLQPLSGASKYAVNFVYRVVASNEKLCYIVLGTQDYKLIDAQNAQPPASVPPEISAICVLVGRIIVANGATSATQIDSAFTIRFGGVSSINFSNILGTVATTQGGTGLTTYALGDTLYASAANTLAALSGSTSATMAVLTQTGTGSVSAAPAWTSTTGTGNVVRATSPTLATPILGVASATSINKVAITTPATSATLTIADGKTLTASNTLTFSGTDGSTLNIGTGGTLGTAAYVADASMVHIAGIETITGAKTFSAITAISNTTASTTPTTGSLINAGGFGNAGNANIGGRASIGTGVISAGTLLYLGGTAEIPGVSGTTQYGIILNATPSSAATGSYNGIYVQPRSAAAAYTVSEIRGLYVESPSIGSGSTVTSAYAIRTNNVTGAGTNYQLYLGTGISVLNDTTDSTSTTTGSFQTKGGAAIVKALWVGGLSNIAGVLTAANTTDASALGTAGTVISGGLSVAKKQFLGDLLVVPKTSGMGIKVDTTTPTYPWKDLFGILRPDPGGANSPTLAVFRGGIVRRYFFSVNDKMDMSFHIPHDYAPGTDLFIHIHWSHNGTAITGTFTASIANTYAKGHNQASFPAEKTVAVSYATVNIATTPQYIHRIDQVQLSSAGGSATLWDTALIEPDGVIDATMTVTAIPTITGGTTNEPTVDWVDLHYQSTGIGTKANVPNFYV